MPQGKTYRTFVVKVRKAIGVTHPQATLAVSAVIRAVHDTLLEGKEVRWDGLGTFQLVRRTGRIFPARTMKGGKGNRVIHIPEINTRDSVRVRFVASESFRHKLNGKVSPTQVRSPACAPSPNTSSPKV